MCKTGYYHKTILFLADRFHVKHNFQSLIKYFCVIQCPDTLLRCLGNDIGIIYYSKKVLHHLIFTKFLSNVLNKYTKHIF